MTSDRRRLAPRTSEDEALFIANKYAKNKLILEAKLANSLNGGRMVRQTMLDDVANELSAKFNVASRSRKYVEQKLRDMKKEARKFYYLQHNAKTLENGGSLKGSAPRTPPEPIRVMIEAMADELKAGAPIEELDLYGKSVKADKPDVEVERDEPTSRQSAASSSGDSTHYGDGGAEPTATVMSTPTSAVYCNGNETAVKTENDENFKTKSSTIDATMSNWSAIYGQSLTALMLGLNGESLAADAHARNGCNAKSRNRSAASTVNNYNSNANSQLDFFAALRQMMVDASNNGSGNNGCDVAAVNNNNAIESPPLPPSSVVAAVAPPSAASGGNSAEEMLLKALAASSFFLPNFYFPPPPLVGGTSALESGLLGGDFFNSNSSTKAHDANAHGDKSAHNSNRQQKCKEDAKNVSNPCSPFSASAGSGAESPRHSADAVEESENLNVKILGKNFGAEIFDARAAKGAKKASATIVNADVHSQPEHAYSQQRTATIIKIRPLAQRRVLNGTRLRHTLMRRLSRTGASSAACASPSKNCAASTNGAPLSSANENELLTERDATRTTTTARISSCANNVATATDTYDNGCSADASRQSSAGSGVGNDDDDSESGGLALLKRRLLLEEISASRAFTSLCAEVKKSVEEVVKSFIETHRLYAQLIRAQNHNCDAPSTTSSHALAADDDGYVNNNGRKRRADDAVAASAAVVEDGPASVGGRSAKIRRTTLPPPPPPLSFLNNNDYEANNNNDCEANNKNNDNSNNNNVGGTTTKATNTISPA